MAIARAVPREETPSLRAATFVATCGPPTPTEWKRSSSGLPAERGDGGKQKIGEKNAWNFGTQKAT